MNRRSFLKSVLGAAAGVVVGGSLPLPKPLRPPAPTAAWSCALSKSEWITLDQMVLRVARHRLRAWTDLMVMKDAGISMAPMILSYTVTTERVQG